MRSRLGAAAGGAVSAGGRAVGGSAELRCQGGARRSKRAHLQRLSASVHAAPILSASMRRPRHQPQPPTAPAGGAAGARGRAADHRRARFGAGGALWEAQPAAGAAPARLPTVRGHRQGGCGHGCPRQACGDASRERPAILHTQTARPCHGHPHPRARAGRQQGWRRPASHLDGMGGRPLLAGQLKQRQQACLVYRRTKPCRPAAAVASRACRRCRPSAAAVSRAKTPWSPCQASPDSTVNGLPQVRALAALPNGALGSQAGAAPAVRAPAPPPPPPPCMARSCHPRSAAQKTAKPLRLAGGPRGSRDHTVPMLRPWPMWWRNAPGCPRVEGGGAQCRRRKRSAPAAACAWMQSGGLAGVVHRRPSSGVCAAAAGGAPRVRRSGAHQPRPNGLVPQRAGQRVQRAQEHGDRLACPHYTI
ncbi:MAG: hypothetical protein J3K34DRAFT_438538 [Monoraphidium minutum]|nr:MAG: hypothetical protein J3K34DRAFT_438538 [Monoraphidium minutum]